MSSAPRFGRPPFISAMAPPPTLGQRGIPQSIPRGGACPYPDGASSQQETRNTTWAPTTLTTRLSRDANITHWTFRVATFRLAPKVIKDGYALAHTAKGPFGPLPPLACTFNRDDVRYVALETPANPLSPTRVGSARAESHWAHGSTGALPSSDEAMT